MGEFNTGDAVRGLDEMHRIHGAAPDKLSTALALLEKRSVEVVQLRALVASLTDIVREMTDPMLRSHGSDGCETGDWERLRRWASETVGEPDHG